MKGKLRNMAGIYITSNDKMLLLYRVGSRVINPSWSNIGGHFEKDELNDAKAAMLRELNEEVGVNENDLKNIKLRYVTLRLKNDEIRVNYYFFADLKQGVEVQSNCDEGILEWVPLEEVNLRKMPFTAQGVLKHYMDIGKADNKIYAGISMVDEVKFIPLEEF